MSPILRNILAFLVGFIVGNFVNGAIIMASPMIMPYPEGMDPMDSMSIIAHMDEFTTGNFIIPIVAHALGTLIGAMLIIKIAGTSKAKLAYGFGALSLIFGIINAYQIPAPTWFIATDLVIAYIPMAWLATRFVSTEAKGSN